MVWWWAAGLQSFVKIRYNTWFFWERVTVKPNGSPPLLLDVLSGPSVLAVPLVSSSSFQPFFCFWAFSAYKYLKRRGQMDGARLVTAVPSDGTRGNGTNCNTGTLY